MTSNPWLAIPWQDYEGHMSCPAVGQLQLLSSLFAEALASYRPASVAILGCATGNGLEHVDPAVTRTVVGLDLNLAYLAVARRRFAGTVPGLELVACNLSSFDCRSGSLDLVFAGLIFEYLDPRALVGRVAGWLAPQGVLVAVLQLPSETSGKVSETGYASLRLLDDAMTLIEPGDLQRAAEQAGLVATTARTHRTVSGKSLHEAHVLRP